MDLLTGTCRVLIADDDEGDRKQMKRAIFQAGLRCDCLETESAEHALALCEEQAFDCVIFDYHLPGRDGLAGISALHERFPRLPIIMSTGQGDEMVAAAAIKRGASDYIPKVGVNASSIRRVIENAIEKAALQQKVWQQQADLENFARVLAHDLKVPAAAIVTFATRIGERLATGKQEQALRYSDGVIQMADRMCRLIDTLHRYTTSDAKVVFGPVDMGLVAEATLANLIDVVRQSSAQVTATDLPVVLGNAPQLIQLLQNLIGNAIKYCDNPSPVVQLSAVSREDGTWLISVNDNGIGIAEAHYKRVFEPFVRLAETAHRAGSGLGLATCRRIIERHRGSIWCDSKSGSGTTFFFSLPAA